MKHNFKAKCKMQKAKCNVKCKKNYFLPLRVKMLEAITFDI